VKSNKSYVFFTENCCKKGVERMNIEYNSKVPIVGIHEGLDRSRPMPIKRYQIILDYNKIPNFWLNISNIDFWEKIKNINYFIFRFSQYHSSLQLAETILPIIENHYKIKCFPDQNTSWHYDDKIKQYYLLKVYNFPIADTWIFWDKKSAIDFILNYSDFPLVFKLKRGAGSSNVVLIKNKKEGLKIANKMFSKKGILCNKIPLKSNLKYYYEHILTLYPLRRYLAYIRGKVGPEGIHPYWQIQRDYVIFQKFLPQNEFDTRVTVIGNRAFVYRRYNRPGDFRASGSGRIDYNISKIDKECIKLAFEISNKMKFQSMAYDMLYDENKNIKITEISYTFVDILVYNCHGYFDQNMNFHKGHFWPQYCQLQDLIKEVELKQPSEEIMKNGEK